MPKFPISIGTVEYTKTLGNRFNIEISFTNGGTAKYTITARELKAFMEDPTGSFYNKNIRG